MFSFLKSVSGILVSLLLTASVLGDIVIEVEELASGFRVRTSGSITSGDVPIINLEVATSIDELRPSGISAGGSSVAVAVLGIGVVNTPLSSVVNTNVTRSPTSNVGSVFVYRDSAVGLEVDSTFTPGDTITTNADVFWPMAYAGAFGTNLDNGPVLLTTFGNGETISIQRLSVPEPTGVFLPVLLVSLIARGRGRSVGAHRTAC